MSRKLVTPGQESRFRPAAAALLALWACVLARCSKPDSTLSTAPSAAAPATAPASTMPASPASPVVPASGVLAQLTVKVTDLRGHKGQLIFGVFTSADGFPTDDKKAVDWQIKDADTVVFTVNLPPGDYGASVLHDENKNGKMDRGFGGIPKEGYGVTNNPKPALRAATFKEATFTLPPEGRTMTISVQYF